MIIQLMNVIIAHLHFEIVNHEVTNSL